VRTRRTAGAVVGYVVFTAVWFGALVLMFQKNAGCAAIVVFALLGLVLLAAAVDYIAGVSIIRVDRGGISVRRQVLKWNWSWSLASEAIESVESRVDAQSRRRSTFDVAANTRPGRRTLARYIRNADDAEALAARIWSALGRA
jgi:hypothetical protein